MTLWLELQETLTKPLKDHNMIMLTITSLSDFNVSSTLLCIKNNTTVRKCYGSYSSTEDERLLIAIYHGLEFKRQAYFVACWSIIPATYAEEHQS